MTPFTACSILRRTIQTDDNLAHDALDLIERSINLAHEVAHAKHGQTCWSEEKVDTLKHFLDHGTTN